MERDAYLLGLELRIFATVSILYGLCVILSLLYWATGKRIVGRAGITILTLNVFLHTAMIILRIYEGGRAPFQSLYESLSWFAWIGAATYVFIYYTKARVLLPSLIVSLLSFGSSFYAISSRSPSIDPLSPALQSQFFIWHVALSFLSYAVFVVSASFEISSIYAGLMERRRGFSTNPISVEWMRYIAHRLALIGFPLLSFGIISGAAWAYQAWGRFWGWDPKETWSLITWCVYTLYLHSMCVRDWRGWQSSAFNILGFICMIMTFLGVNWLAKLLGIPSLHVYSV